MIRGDDRDSVGFVDRSAQTGHRLVGVQQPADRRGPQGAAAGTLTQDCFDQRQPAAAKQLVAGAAESSRLRTAAKTDRYVVNLLELGRMVGGAAADRSRSYREGASFFCSIDDMRLGFC